MPALTHGRVKNGFNGYATRVILPNGGGLSNTQPIKYNGGQKPKRNFKSEYNAQINAPNALTNSIGSSFTTKRANARRAGDPNRKLLGLPEVSWSAPGQASKRRKVLLASGKEKATSCLPTEYPNSFSFVVGTYTNPPLPPSQFKGFCNYCFVNFGNILPPNCITPPGFIKIEQDTTAAIGNDQIEFFMDGFPPNTTKAITITLNNVNLYNWTGRILPQSSAAGVIQVTDSWDPLMPIWADGDIIKVEFLN